MAVYRKVSGTKWHQTPSGPRVCTASKKACPYSSHFETEEDANDPRDRGVMGGEKEAYNLPFNVVLSLEEEGDLKDGDGEIISAPDHAVNLREMSDRARDTYIRTGKRPSLTTGTMTVDLDNDRRIVIKREIFGRAQKPAARYHVTYWNSPQEYEIDSVNLSDSPSPESYEKLQSMIQSYMETANNENELNIHDKAVSLNKDEAWEEEERARYSARLKKAYEKTIQTLDQVEILSRGPQKVQDYYSIDLFSKEKPGTLNLSADCGQSVFQPEDVVESLKLHAMHDEEAKNISIHVSEQLPGNEGSWALARIPEGTWYFSYAVNKENFTHEVAPADAQEAGSVVSEILREKGMPKEMITSRTNFVTNMVAEVEPAIANYYRTINARQDYSAPKQPQEPRAEKTMKDKLFGMFS